MISVFILLAGKSSRFGGATPKQFLKIKNKYIFEYSLETFDSIKNNNEISLVVDGEHYAFLTKFISQKTYNHNINIILGGNTRQESVFNSLKTLQNSTISSKIVLFHDACRPLIRRREINELIETLKDNDAASIAVPLIDSLCKAENSYIKEPIKRENLYQLQTPQGFKFDIIYKAHLEAAQSKDFSFTDDTSILASKGIKIKLIKGSVYNFKITTKDDLVLFENIVGDFDFD